MTYYLDTSILVAVTTNEPGSEKVEAWLAANEDVVFAISDWTITEFSSALSIKLRRREIDEGQRAGALALFAQTARESFEVLSVSREHFLSAAKLSDRHETGLRGSDALHLAVAASAGAEVVTRDQRLAEAGLVCGVLARLV